MRRSSCDVVNGGRFFFWIVAKVSVVHSDPNVFRVEEFVISSEAMAKLQSNSAFEHTPRCLATQSLSIVKFGLAMTGCHCLCSDVLQRTLRTHA